MILSDKNINTIIDKKDLIVEPLTNESIQPGSIDCRLGNHFINKKIKKRLHLILKLNMKKLHKIKLLLNLT